MAKPKSTHTLQKRKPSKRKLSQADVSGPGKRRKVTEETKRSPKQKKPTQKRRATKAKKATVRKSAATKIKKPGMSSESENEETKTLTPKSPKSPKRGTSRYSSKARKYIGAHVSIAGHLSNAVKEAVELGARAFGMFLKSQRQWAAKPLDEKVAHEFRESCKENGFESKFIVPHGSYLMNLASPKAESLTKSRAMFVDELQRCEKLGLTLFNFHPGSTCGEITVEQGIKKIADSINQAHKKTTYVITVLENMCQQGNTIGGRFEELAAIISHVTNKKRVGVCLDTCHAFAAGFDLSTEDGFNGMMADFEKIVGMKYLKAVHVNDSKGTVGCHLDRHENIGRGKIGIAGFRRIMNDPRFDDIPFVLETPETDYAKEIRRLYGLCAT